MLPPPTRIFLRRIRWIREASWIVCRVSEYRLGSGEMWARRAACKSLGIEEDFWDCFTPTWQLTEPSTSRRSWVTLLSLKGRCRCPLSTPRMTFPSPACTLVSSSVMWMARFTWVMLPPRVLVRSQQPKSIRWRRLRPPRRDGVAGVEGFRLKTLRYNSL